MPHAPLFPGDHVVSLTSDCDITWVQIKLDHAKQRIVYKTQQMLIFYRNDKHEHETYVPCILEIVKQIAGILFCKQTKINLIVPSMLITMMKSAKSIVKNCLKCANSVAIVMQLSIFVLMTQSYHTFQPKKTIAMLILYFSKHTTKINLVLLWL